MNYSEEIDKILETGMTERCFKLWKGIKERVPNIWDRPTSSTGKHHRRTDGTIPSCAEHVYEMLIACAKLLSIFNIEVKSAQCDILLFSVALHDAFKYGVDNALNRPYTDNGHDRLAGNIVRDNKLVFMKIFNEGQVNLLEKCVRYHTGRWSTDAEKDFNFKDFPTEVFFVHMLDMLSTLDLLNIGKGN